MLPAIVNRLKTGRIKNVVAKGSPRPKPPYIVVDPQQDALNRGWRLFIWVHMLPVQQQDLWVFTTSDLMTLLDDYQYVDQSLNTNEVLTEQERSGIIVNNDDGTISMRREFLIPSRTF